MGDTYLACPFCGEDAQRIEAKMVGEPYDDAMVKVYRIRCNCGVSTPYRQTATEVSDMWHTRDGFHHEPSEADQGLIPIPGGYNEA